MPGSPARPAVPEEVLAFYGALYDEGARLHSGAGRLELARTQDLLQRHLPPPPAVVFDVGGGTGVYALWLAAQGYEAHLVDVVPGHVEKARRASAAQHRAPLASCSVGDARQLARADASVAAVLLLGPLYHLTERHERIAALREARRILEPGGVLIAAGVSRFASALDGLQHNLFASPVFAEIVERDLRDGQHRSPPGRSDYFTTAYFHRPEELADEVAEAGLAHVATVGVEGPAWLMGELDEICASDERRARLLRILRALEAEPALLGASAHLAVVARRAR